MSFQPCFLRGYDIGCGVKEGAIISPRMRGYSGGLSTVDARPAHPLFSFRACLLRLMHLRVDATHNEVRHGVWASSPLSAGWLRQQLRKVTCRAGTPVGVQP
ncbi:hypothetical protein KEM60_02044 [Austwickia sp. TVS 96-490-7B]|nr:hypothetical protein [Austwickia sp. TVS 96-490-7B]